MKKLICLMLCLCVAVCSLVACKEDVIGEELDELRDKVKIEEVTEIELDFYVIVGEGTTENAMSTVELMINQYLEKFKTSLDIHYLTAAEYKDTVMNDIALSGDDRADIILVTDDAMFDSLYEDHLIANITDYFNPINSPYRSLNTQICSALLSGVTVPETVTNSSGVEYIQNSKYVVPNNRIVGEYEIFLLSVEVADYYNIGSDTFAALTKEEITERVYAKIDADPAHKYTREQAIISTTGTYADYLGYENGGLYYVKSVAPAISRAEAFAGGFAIVRHDLDQRHVKGWEEIVTQDQINTYTKYYDRCMEIIYDLNTSAEFRNLLQYGKINTNYKLDATTGTVTHDTVAAEDVYVMDLAHTGDIFKAYFCECEKHSWTAFHKQYGEQQNKDAVYAQPVVSE